MLESCRLREPVRCGRIVSKGVTVHDQTVEIVVSGPLSPDLVVTALEGFTVTTDEQGRTHVVGPVPDQARLIGLLAMFDGLHIAVISVNPIDDGDSHPHRVT